MSGRRVIWIWRGSYPSFWNDPSEAAAVGSRYVERCFHEQRNVMELGSERWRWHNRSSGGRDREQWPGRPEWWTCTETDWWPNWRAKWTRPAKRINQLNPRRKADWKVAWMGRTGLSDRCFYETWYVNLGKGQYLQNDGWHPAQAVGEDDEKETNSNLDFIGGQWSCVSGSPDAQK